MVLYLRLDGSNEGVCALDLHFVVPVRHGILTPPFTKSNCLTMMIWRSNSLAPSSSKYLSRWFITYTPLWVTARSVKRWERDSRGKGPYRYFLNLIALLQEMHSPLQLGEILTCAVLLDLLLCLQIYGWDPFFRSLHLQMKGVTFWWRLSSPISEPNKSSK